MRLFRKLKPPVAPTAPSPSGATPSAPVSTRSTVVSAPKPVEPQFLELFDSKWYLEVNEDVAAAGVDALTHFISVR